MKSAFLDRMTSNEFCNFGRFWWDYRSSLDWLQLIQIRALRELCITCWNRLDRWHTKCSYLTQTSPEFLCSLNRGFSLWGEGEGGLWYWWSIRDLTYASEVLSWWAIPQVPIKSFNLTKKCMVISHLLTLSWYFSYKR